MNLFNRPINLCRTSLGDQRHICAFFRDAEEEYRALTPLNNDGFDRGDRAYHVVDPMLRDEHGRRLAASGIDVRDAVERRQLEFRDWRTTYLREGRFDQTRVPALLAELFDEGRQAGFPLTRYIAHMEWALESNRHARDRLEHEVRFNQAFPGGPDVVNCCYDLTRFDASLAMDVLRTHPVAIVGGLLQVNPVFVPPAELLRELAQRKDPKGGA